MRIAQSIGIGLIALSLNGLSNPKGADLPPYLDDWTPPVYNSQFEDTPNLVSSSVVPQTFDEPFQLLYRPTIGRLPVVYNASWGGNIDLETYRNDRCGCNMCNGIRQLQKDGRAKLVEEYNEKLVAYNGQQNYLRDLITKSGSDVELDLATQQGTPIGVVRETLSLMALGPSDLLGDYGCGDGRVLIEGVHKYGCQTIGIEIDPRIALLAAQNVERAGLQNFIKIYVGDVRGFDPKAHQLTAIYCYLYDELLGQLGNHFDSVRVVGSPYHKISNSREYGDVPIYVRNNLTCR